MFLYVVDKFVYFPTVIFLAELTEMAHTSADVKFD